MHFQLWGYREDAQPIHQHGLAYSGLRPPPASRLCQTLVPSPALCAQPLISVLGPVPKAFKPFGRPALVQQAPAAIILAALRHFRGPAPFGGPRPCPSPGSSFWPSGLTLRSSGPAFCGPLTLAVSLRKTRNIEAHVLFNCVYLLKLFSAWFLPCDGLRLFALRQFSAFLPAVRRLRGAVLFPGLRPSSIWGFPFWLLWLTGQSSRPAFGGRLTFFR